MGAISFSFSPCDLESMKRFEALASCPLAIPSHSFGVCLQSKVGQLTAHAEQQIN
jgi:hypothetical protein